MGFIATNSLCDLCGMPFDMAVPQGTHCPDCIAISPAFDKGRSVFRYNSHSGVLITGLKYSDKTPYAKTLSRLMSNRVPELGQFDVITSVPIHPRRLLKRKYNQSALLARRIGRLCNISVNNLMLHKKHDADPQASLSREKRIKNARNAYSVNLRHAVHIKGKSILLVDDVLTTGATAHECAKVLKASGAGRVCVITAARTPLEN